MTNNIQIHDTNETISLKITIEFSGATLYNYTSGKRTFTYPEVLPKPLSRTVELGTGHEMLHLYNRNDWSVRLLNQSVEKRDYKIMFEWFQGGRLLYVYPENPSEREGILEPESSKDFESNCVFDMG